MKRGGNQAFASPEAALQHYGVKGMRWGVRKEDSPSGLVGNLVAPKSSMSHGLAEMELMGNDLTVDHSRGYAVFRPPDFPANPSVARRHEEILSALDGVREAYPAVAKMNVEVVPMSRVPHQAHMVTGSFACVQAVKKGEALIMYNDKLGELSPQQDAFVNSYMPGMATKGYVGFHEMGHVLAIANGTQPPSYTAMVNGSTPRDIRKYDKQNQKSHKAMLKKHGLSYRKVRKLSKYARTMPSEAVAELIGHTLSPEMRKTLDPDTLRRAEAMINEMGGVQ